ncbi:MAG: acyl carrier protein [Kiritimatiellia bacterium]
MTSRETLVQLLADIFPVDPAEVRMDLSRADLPTWDSLAVVSIAVGVHQTFGYHFTPAEANGIQKFQDIIDLLKARGAWHESP